MPENRNLTCVCGHKQFHITDNKAHRQLKPNIICTKCGRGWCSGYDAEPYASSKFVIDERAVVLGPGGVIMKYRTATTPAP